MNLSELTTLGDLLRERSGVSPAHVYDTRIDDRRLHETTPDSLISHVKHQALMRCYQSRFVLLPSATFEGSLLDQMRRHYDPFVVADLDRAQVALEQTLIEPLARQTAEAMQPQSCARYIESMLKAIANSPPSAFLTWLDGNENRLHHYRNFLIQSSADLLAEASASALGVIGEFGPPQSALFRILIDEFGYGVHDKKHSVLYRRTMRGFQLNEEYNGYWHLFDTPALVVHNVIHYLFQNPRNFFRQIGFLLYAETSYQKSTGEHYRHIRKFYPDVDATYFGEHAHIDIHHSQMVLHEVVEPLVAKFGEEVGTEIILGAELTKAAFAAADAHMLALSQAFDAAVTSGEAHYGLPSSIDPSGICAAPDAIGESQKLQIGGIGWLTNPAAFATFPSGSIGRGCE